eukprot:Seg5197.2 transcript_id=Seg5197.2/GoldUCD/mRNA.D3Y31 product="Acid-sensing ion channel 4-A" protein_id=Seg5197.2/GoldUCD/D3Y31
MSSKSKVNEKSMALEVQRQREHKTSILLIDEDGEEITTNSIVSNYFQSTTIHGISSIYNGRNIFMKLFWLVIFLNVFALLAWQVYKISVRLNKNEVLTMVENTAYQSMEFPAVTLCSTRPFRKSFSFGEFSAAKFDSMTSNLSRYGLTIDEFLMHEKLCTFDQYQCSFKDDFFVTTSWSLGNCFTLKANTSRRQRHLGLKHGFRLGININQDKFTNYDSTASDGRDIDKFPPVGVKVMIHNRNENIDFFAHTDAILVSPGTMTSIHIKKQNIKRLPPPFPDRCVEEETADEVIGRPIPSTTSYSVGLCEFMCEIREKKKFCNAVEVDDINQLKLLFPNGTFNYRTPATTEEYKCVDDEFEKHSNITRDCNCPQPCKEQKYRLTVSTAVWPSNDNVPYICSLLNSARIHFGSNCSKEAIKDNILRLEVSFKDFTVESIKQSPAYGSDQFISDLGGSVGLWIGASVYSLFELTSMCISLATLVLYKLRKSVKMRSSRVKSFKPPIKIKAEEARLEALAV